MNLGWSTSSFSTWCSDNILWQKELSGFWLTALLKGESVCSGSLFRLLSIMMRTQGSKQELNIASHLHLWSRIKNKEYLLPLRFLSQLVQCRTTVRERYPAPPPPKLCAYFPISVDVRKLISHKPQACQILLSPVILDSVKLTIGIPHLWWQSFSISSKP